MSSSRSYDRSHLGGKLNSVLILPGEDRLSDQRRLSDKRLSGEFLFRGCCRSALKSPWITPVRDQGRTNSCYAFVVVAALYGAGGGKVKQGSVQELVDCLHKYYPYNQNELDQYRPEGWGNSFENAFAYLKVRGLFFEEDYPWKGTCQEHPNLPTLLKPKMYIKGYEWINSHEEIVQQLDQKQPLPAGIPICESFFKWGSNDQVYVCPSDEELERAKAEARKQGNEDPTMWHAVLLIDHGEDQKGEKYYLCQNSYGEEWGCLGCFKLRADEVARRNVCYPTGVYIKDNAKG